MTKLTSKQMGLKDIVEINLGMTFDEGHALAAYDEIGGAFLSKALVEDFRDAYMARMFAA